jgi:hypothetical protein
MNVINEKKKGVAVVDLGEALFNTQLFTTGTDVMILKIFSQIFLAKKLAFLTQNSKVNYAKF